jgi:hypothetical protein
MTFGEGTHAAPIGTILRNLLELESQGSADAIAAFLALMGMTGTPKCASACPVYKRLTQGLYSHGAESPRVTAGIGCINIDFFPTQDGWVGERLVIDTPPNIAAFIRAFDNGKYAHLSTEGK